jgi:hypothetical protein
LKLTEACKRMVNVRHRAFGDCVRASRAFKRLRLDVTNARHSAIMQILYGARNSTKVRFSVATLETSTIAISLLKSEPVREPKF